MCDFSLEHLASRPAIGDQLVTTKFGRAYTTGLCAGGEPSVAVLQSNPEQNLRSSEKLNVRRYCS
jgi:hypothetical protein